MKRTKIVCTIGPASESVDMLCALLRAGMNVARLNFSHGSHEEHAQRIQNIRLASRQCDIPVAIMLDTKGPEIRTGNFKDGRVTLTAGQKVTVTTEMIEGDAKRFAVNYSQLAQEVHPGDTILLDDRLADQIAPSDHLLLHQGHLFGGDLNTQITTGDHQSIGYGQYLLQMIDTLLILDLGYDMDVGLMFF